MRIRRSNPFNAVGRLPTAPRALAVAVLAAIVLGAFGVWAELKVSAEGADHVRQALAARGYGAAKVEAVRKGGCGRVRRLYAWTAGTATGTACAGPRDRVEIRPSAA
jgi:hypothetical protein